MKSIIQTRFMRWRLEWKSLIVRLLLPMILTIFLLKIINVWVDETKVPIGLVIEDETNLVTQLVYDISNTQLLDIHFLQRPEALQKLEAHELDSVFIIRKDYEKNILVNQRNQLIEAYASNRSFAYSIVTEIISSFAQQDASRSKAAFEVKHLYKKYDLDEQWQWEEIVAKSRERQQSESLLTTELSFQNSDGSIQEDPTPLLQTWGIWSLLTLLTTFLLYDWVLKEHTSAIKPRWLFAKISFTQYATLHFVIYTILLLAMDLTTVVVFHFFYQEHITISFIFSLLIFRLTINLFAFLLANQFKQVLFYYVSSIALTLLLGLFGGAIIPLDGLRNTLSWTNRTKEECRQLCLDMQLTHWNERVHSLSGGMKRKLNLAISLLNNPILLLLDEPTVGIDLKSKNEIGKVLVDLAKSEGRTIIYTSHDMDEIRNFCDRVYSIGKDSFYSEYLTKKGILVEKL